MDGLYQAYARIIAHKSQWILNEVDGTTEVYVGEQRRHRRCAGLFHIKQLLLAFCELRCTK